MEVYILLYVLIFIFGIIYQCFKTKPNSKKIYCIVVTILLIIVAGARDERLGNSDTVEYYIPRFNLIKNLSIEETYEVFKETDPLFYVFTKIITEFDISINWYFMICIIPIILGSVRIIYKYSKIPMLSFFMFLGLGYYFTAFITIRNSLAFGLLLFSFEYLYDRKFIKFLMIVLFASIFHSSAILFIFAYFITKLDFKIDLKCFFVFLCFVIIVIFKEYFMNLVFSFIKNEHVLLYKDRNIYLNFTLFFEYLILFIYSAFFIRLYSKINNDEKNILYNLSYIGTLIAMLVVIQDVMYRVSAFYNFYYVILIPNCIDLLKKEKNKWLVTTVLLIFFTIWGIKYANDINLIPYKMWF